jgi:hypothetical protein
VDVAAVVAEVAERFRPMAVGRGIVITVEGAPAHADADRDRLAQIVANYLSNAVRHGPDGSSIEVLTERRPDGRVRVGVTDHGTGLAGDQLEVVFERFYRVDPARSRTAGGSGIGLAIVERVIRRPPRQATAMEAPVASTPTGGIAAWPIWPHVYTLAVVIVGWVFFRADTLHSAVLFLEAMAGLSPAAPTALSVQWYLTPEVWLALVAGAIGSTPWVPAPAAKIDRDGGPLRVAASLASTAMLVALLVASIMQMAARTYNPFIYFRF